MTVALSGRIDSGNAAAEEEALKAAVNGFTGALVLDAADLEYISSAGLRVLLHFLPRQYGSVVSGFRGILIILHQMLGNAGSQFFNRPKRFSLGDFPEPHRSGVYVHLPGCSNGKHLGRVLLSLISAQIS
ncbi:MAG: STAS domain-containing protein [Clostridia bacterium]|nr:STAS domain-containing protein [Clostridia bacterium]